MPESDSPVDQASHRRRLWIETAVVVAAGVLPDAISSVVLLGEPIEPPSFAGDAIMLIVRSVQVSAVVLFVMSRSGEPWGRFGIKQPRILDIATGAGLYALTLIATLLFWRTAWHLPGVLWLYDRVGTSSSVAAFPAPATSLDWCLVGPMSMANGIAEQLVVSAFLVTRLEVLLKGTGRAIIVAALCFTSYHLYQGPAASVSILVIGLVNASAFAVIRRFWPLALGHAFADAVAIMWS